jgi:hypothetical protein
MACRDTSRKSNSALQSPDTELIDVDDPTACSVDDVGRQSYLIAFDYSHRGHHDNPEHKCDVHGYGVVQIIEPAIMIDSSQFDLEYLGALKEPRHGAGQS